ncbi:hypothetical protein QQF64_032608 [Cirrhinus molitorella]|uniref:Uncharacterized protein n=1 Tax=Cirrhinus molitorella TaxID=172907 RepID=A0ABR3N0C0_9TELE
MRQLCVLLPVLWSLINSSHSWPYDYNSSMPDAPVPIITVYQQIQDREQVIVMCSFGRRHYRSSFLLSVDCEQNYTLKNPECIAHDVCVFNITVRPPVSLTCIHEIITYGYESYVQSETYVLDYHDGVSSFYIGFFSFIVVGVIIMTAAVIVTTVRSNAQDQTRVKKLDECPGWTNDSSDGWYWNYHSTPGWYWNYDATTAPTTSSSLCWYWYNRPCNWDTTQSPSGSTSQYQTQTQTPYWRNMYDQKQTQTPYRRNTYYQTQTQTPYRRNVYYQTQTQTPSWRKPYYYATTQNPYWRNMYYQTQTQAPSWRRPYYYGPTQTPYRKKVYYQTQTQNPYWRNMYFQTQTQAPSWRRPYYYGPTQTPYRRKVYYQTQTQNPYWRNMYFQTQTQAPSWRRPYYYGPTQNPYWRNMYDQTQTQAPSWRRPYYYGPTQTPYRRNVYYQPQTPFWHIQDGHHSDVPVPNITVFRQMEDRERVIVICSFGRNLIESSFQLSVKSKYNYAFKNPQCFSNAVCVFDVKVSPPVSFTCVHQINSVVNRQSETYIYSQSDSASDPHCSDPHDGGVSSFYMSFFSFIAVGLFIMIAAVIMVTIKSKAKGSKNTASYNDYIDGDEAKIPERESSRNQAPQAKSNDDEVPSNAKRYSDPKPTHDER